LGNFPAQKRVAVVGKKKAVEPEMEIVVVWQKKGKKQTTTLKQT